MLQVSIGESPILNEYFLFPLKASSEAAPLKTSRKGRGGARISIPKPARTYDTRAFQVGSRAAQSRLVERPGKSANLSLQTLV